MTHPTTPLPDSTATGLFGKLSPNWGIMLVSVLGLFLEMLLIRWIGTEVRIFAYLQNTVLVVCILGLGMGCFTCRRPVQLRQMLVPLLCVVTLLAIPITRQLLASISELLGVMSDFVIWNQAVSENPWTTIGSVGLGLTLTFMLMLLLWEIFVPVGRILGRLMDDHPRTIEAYSVNVVGSLLGIWLFVGLSALYAAPWMWFAIAAVLAFGFIGLGRERLGNLGLLGTIVALAWFAGSEAQTLEAVWSPYQKLVVLDNRGKTNALIGEYVVLVNNVGYQGMLDLRPEAVAKNKRIPAEMRGLSQYDLPMQLHPTAKHVLIVGAGSGNDAAGLLRGGAEQVTAVEIDPAIIELGKKYHPEQPYSSDKVTVVNDDARSFFATTTERYDLIVFGLLDSHTTTAMTNARLDHYVYTRESIAQARSLLTPQGVMVLSFDATRPFVAQRMENCLTEVFNTKPQRLVIPPSYSGWGGVTFITGDQEVVRQSLAHNPRLAKQVAAWESFQIQQVVGDVEIASDNWPYIYLESRKIPTLYFLLAGLLGGLFWYCQRRLQTATLGLSWNAPQWHFFLLGAAFMLLEVHSISKAAVVLGNTWVVNAVIISGILLMILVSNLVTVKFPRIPQSWVATGLIGSCLGLYCLDLSQFAFLPYASKALIVGVLCAVPMFFSGLIFIASFRQTAHKDHALGANLFGSLFGGLLQSLTFVIGLNALMLIVAALYSTALILGRKVGKEVHPQPPAGDETAEDQQESPAELVEV